MSATLRRGLFVGRFQPLHRGHLELLRGLRRARPEELVLVGIGSAQESFTWDNPFTAGERFDMIEQALAEAHLEGVVPVPIPDIRRHALWVRYLEGLLPPFARVYTNNPLTRALFEAAGYNVESPPWVDREHLVGVGIRRALANGESVTDRVPPAVARWLEGHRAGARLKMVAQEGAAARELRDDGRE